MNEIELAKYFYAYTPSAILVIGAIVVMLGNVFARYFSRSVSLSLCMIFIISSFLFSMSLGHMASVEYIALIAEILILIGSFFFVFLTFSKYRYNEFQTPEFYPLYLFSVAGFLLMVTADNLILVLLGLEIGSLPLAAIIAFNRRIYGIEAGIKYFIASALASILFIMGLMLFYLYTGDFNISSAMYHYREYSKYEDGIYLLIAFGGAMFIIAGLGFKISLFPWHGWMADIYEASNPVIAGYISIVPKIAGFAVFLSVFSPIFGVPDMADSLISKLLWVMLILTITLPNIAALLQKDMKRMLAFSSISHSGFALACVYLGSVNLLALYWGLFLITNVGSFALLWIYRPSSLDYSSQIRFDYNLENLNGFSKVCPIGALAIAFFMVALAGIPPFSIFWGKIFVVMSALSRGDTILALVLMLNSAIAVCYYLKPIVAMYFRQKVGNAIEYHNNSTASIRFVVLLCVLLVACSIFILSPFMSAMPFA